MPRWHKKELDYAKQSFIRYHYQTNWVCTSWFFVTTLTKLYFKISMVCPEETHKRTDKYSLLEFIGNFVLIR